MTFKFGYLDLLSVLPSDRLQREFFFFSRSVRPRAGQRGDRRAVLDRVSVPRQ